MAISNDPVHHPKHYTFGEIEVIDVLEDWNLNFHRANAVKYIARAGRKDPKKEAEDLKKAVFYLNRDIERLEKQLKTKEVLLNGPPETRSAIPEAMK